MYIPQYGGVPEKEVDPRRPMFDLARALRKMRPQICIDNTAKPQSAELPTQETPRQNWAETIQEVIQQEQKKEIADGLYEKGWGYGRIAKILKVGKSTIQDWVKGKRYESVPQQNSDNSPTPTENLETIMIHAGRGL